MMGRHAVPAVTFGQHLGQQAGSLLRGGAPARKTAFAGELAEGGRIAAADEVRLAHEDRPIGHEPPEHLSPANDRLFVCRVGLGQGVCLVRIVAPERLLVMHAVDRQRLVHKAIAAIDHYRPRGIQRRHLARRPGDLRLHGLVKTEVAGIDEGDLVLDRPDEDRRVVAFLLDPRLQLFDPVVKELLAVGQLVQIIGPLSVEDAAAANDDSPRIHQIQSLLFVEAAELPAPKSPHVLAAGAPLGDGRLGVFSAVIGRAIGPKLPGHAVELELRAVPLPLAEAERRRAHVRSDARRA